MRPAIVHTGGLILLSESFEGDITRNHDVFRKSLQLMFQCDESGRLNMAFGSQVEVHCSREIKVWLPPVAHSTRGSATLHQIYASSLAHATHGICFRGFFLTRRPLILCTPAKNRVSRHWESVVLLSSYF